MLLQTTLSLRYETTAEQLRSVLAGLHELLLTHPKVVDDSIWVRFAGFGAYSLDIQLFAYVDSSDRLEFFADPRGDLSADHGPDRRGRHRLRDPVADPLPRPGARPAARAGRPPRRCVPVRRSQEPAPAGAPPREGERTAVNR